MSNLLQTIVLWVLKLIPAGILLQTVFLYKFANGLKGHPESIELFQTMSDAIGNVLPENVFRLGTGFAELIASILILIPKTARYGAILIALIMLGAVASHLGPLGTEGPVFIMALLVLGSVLIYLFLSKKWGKS